MHGARGRDEKQEKREEVIVEKVEPQPWSEEKHHAWYEEIIERKHAYLHG